MKGDSVSAEQSGMNPDKAPDRTPEKTISVHSRAMREALVPNGLTALDFFEQRLAFGQKNNKSTIIDISSAKCRLKQELFSGDKS